MQKRLYFGLILVIFILLCSCTRVNNTPLPTNEIQNSVTAIADISSPTIDIPKTTPAKTQTPPPEHSDLYLPNYTNQQIFEYFEEVVLNSEYSDGTGNTAVVQKWTEPILYRIYGDPTDEDISLFKKIFNQLNEIHGFPGIHEAIDVPHTLTISFLNYDDFNMNFQSFLNGEDAYGAARFWYNTETNEIFTADVGYRIDIDESSRKSVLIEELINMLGISDTALREDSIVYQYSDDNTALSDMDWLILQLLYNPAIKCGMNVDECRKVIQKLYY